MTSQLILTICPDSEVASALDTAYANSKSSDASNSRRSKYEYTIPGTSSTISVFRHESSLKDKQPNSKKLSTTKKSTAESTSEIYSCVGEPSNYLAGSRAFTSNFRMKTLVPVQMALFRAALKDQFPKLKDSVIEAIKDTDCEIDSAIFAYYFEFENQTEAYQALQDLHRHSEVVIDCATRKPTRTNEWRKSYPRVRSSTESRHAFSILLPFGQANISLKREHDEYPEAILSIASISKRNKSILLVERILCIEITVDISKFCLSDIDGMDILLPSNFQQWTPKAIKTNPIELIWSAFCSELSLQMPLANEVDQIDESCLSDSLKEILKDYLAGKDVRVHPLMNKKTGLFMKNRAVLLAKTGVDILNPWAINQLNLSEKLGELFKFENHMILSENPPLAEYSLTPENTSSAILKLCDNMVSTPGWFYSSET